MIFLAFLEIQNHAHGVRGVLRGAGAAQKAALDIRTALDRRAKAGFLDIHEHTRWLAPGLVGGQRTLLELHGVVQIQNHAGEVVAAEIAHAGEGGRAGLAVEGRIARRGGPDLRGHGRGGGLVGCGVGHGSGAGLVHGAQQFLGRHGLIAARIITHHEQQVRVGLILIIQIFIFRVSLAKQGVVPPGIGIPEHLHSALVLRHGGHEILVAPRAAAQLVPGEPREIGGPRRMGAAARGPGQVLEPPGHALELFAGGLGIGAQGSEIPHGLAVSARRGGPNLGRRSLGWRFRLGLGRGHGGDAPALDAAQQPRRAGGLIALGV